MSRPVPDVPIAELNARSEHVKLLDVQVLSDNWYVLRKVTRAARTSCCLLYTSDAADE